MIESYKEIKQLVAANAQHRSGFRLQDQDHDQIISRAIVEMNELRDEEGDPDAIYEMADVMAPLLHYCINEGWTLEMLDVAILYKLKMRFPDYYQRKGSFHEDELVGKDSQNVGYLA